MTNKVLHLDLLELVKGKTLSLTVPLEITGTPVGIKMGGIMERFLWDIDIETIPSNIPEKIEVDVTDFEIGDSLHVRDLKVDEGVKITLPEDEVVLTIALPAKVEEVEEVEATAEGEEGETPAGETTEGEKSEKSAKAEGEEKK